MMLPPVRFCATMPLATRCVHRYTWRRFALYKASQPFSLVSRSDERNTPPALFTRIVTGPSSATVWASAASTCAPSRTSVVMPSAPISSAADAHVDGSRSQMATRAPKAASPAAMPRPMPAPPPVTTATRSVSRMSEGDMGIALNIGVPTCDEGAARSAPCVANRAGVRRAGHPADLRGYWPRVRRPSRRELVAGRAVASSRRSSPTVRTAARAGVPAVSERRDQHGRRQCIGVGQAVAMPPSRGPSAPDREPPTCSAGGARSRSSIRRARRRRRRPRRRSPGPAPRAT